MNETGIEEPDWFGFDWTPWLDIDADTDELRQLPTGPGLYRVRHETYDGLIYIGETGRSVRGRVRSLVRNIYAEQMPYSDPHTAAPSLWAVADKHGPGFEISGVAPDRASQSQQRKVIEDALIAVHRRETGTNLIGNFGRMPSGYSKSKSRSTGIRGERDPSADRSFREGIDPLPWDNPTELTAPDWMGLSWTAPEPLATASSDLPTGPGVYRLWAPDAVPPLEYIGQSSNLRRRVNKHRRERDGELVYSYSERPDLERQFQRLQLEATLLGAHWLACEAAPRAQY